MAILKDGKVISSRLKKAKQIKQESIVGKSFYFLGPRNKNFPLYTGYILEDYGPKILVKLLKRSTRQITTCTIRKEIITYETKLDHHDEF